MAYKIYYIINKLLLNRFSIFIVTLITTTTTTNECTQLYIIGYWNFNSFEAKKKSEHNYT